MPHKELQNLSGLRKQILSNVAIAFPLLHKKMPQPNTDGQRYSIITSLNDEDLVSAMVVYGPENSVFATASAQHFAGDALSKLWQVTSHVIGELESKGKFKIAEGGVEVFDLGLEVEGSYDKGSGV